MRNNIHILPEVMEWEGVDWIVLAQDRGQVVGSCAHGDELSGSIRWVNILTRLGNAVLVSQEGLCSTWLVAWLVSEECIF